MLEVVEDEQLALVRQVGKQLGLHVFIGCHCEPQRLGNCLDDVAVRADIGEADEEDAV
jgi:hypothetical protein